MERFDDLDVLRDHVWTYVQAAGTDRKHPFRTPTFGTAGIDPPNLRTVVLRAVDPADRLLAFHSDRRSGKIGEIRSHDRIVWHGWDPGRSQQLRLHGTATVHTDDEVADALWKAGTPEELKLYVRPTTPGTKLDAPGDGLAGAAKNADLTRDDVAPGRKHFAAIRTVIDEVYVLHLHAEGHYRARFRFDAARQEWDGSWIVP